MLGWGRSYISQLLTKQKTLRVEQIVMILNVVSVEPKDFWAEIYQFGPFGAAGNRRRRKGRERAPLPSLDEATPGADMRRVELLYEGIVNVLKRKDLIATAELADAIARAKSGQVVLPGRTLMARNAQDVEPRPRAEGGLRDPRSPAALALDEKRPDLLRVASTLSAMPRRQRGHTLGRSEAVRMFRQGASVTEVRQKLDIDDGALEAAIGGLCRRATGREEW